MTHKVIVAVVDDDDSLRESLPDLLKSLGFSAHAYSSAEKFLASDSISDTKCLVLDIAMPGDLRIVQHGHRVACGLQQILETFLSHSCLPVVGKL